MKMTLEQCRALEMEIRRRGGPLPHHRAMFARACAELDMAERQAADGMGVGPLMGVVYVLGGIAAALGITMGIGAAKNLYRGAEQAAEAFSTGLLRLINVGSWTLIGVTVLVGLRVSGGFGLPKLRSS